MHGRAESQVTLASRSSAVEKAMQMEIQKVRPVFFCSIMRMLQILLAGKIVVKDDGFSGNQFPKRLINSSHTDDSHESIIKLTSLNLSFYKEN